MMHAFLEVGKRFATWITERISEYEFVENQDFLIIFQNREKIDRSRPAKDYHLTLDTAKELAMVESNEKRPPDPPILHRVREEAARRNHQHTIPSEC